MDESEQEVRPGSDNSENGFVEVTREDAQVASQSWEQPSSLDDDADLYGSGDAGDDGVGEDDEVAAAVELEQEKPPSPPPSPVSPEPTASEQLIDFGFGDKPPQTTPPEGTLLVAMAPEPLVPTDQSSGISFDDVIQLMPDPLVPTTQEAPPVPTIDQSDLFLTPETKPPTEPEPTTPPAEREPSPPPPPVPKRDPSPPPPPPPDREPTPPPKDEPSPPPPEHEPTPPPPEQEPTPPPPPPPKDPVMPSEQTIGSPGVEEVTPTPSTTSTTHKKEHMPKPRGYLKFLRALHPVALYIIYWCDLKLSTVVLGVCLVVLLTLKLNTLLHTWVLLLLSFMVVSLTYIVIKIIIDSFYNKKVKNPFHSYLEKEITLPEDLILEWTVYAIKRVELNINRVVRLLLFANIKQSLAFGVSLWLVSFVTNYLTLLSAMFLLVGMAFSVPWLYHHFQSHVDTHVETLVTNLGAVTKKVMTYVPLGGKKKAD